MNSPGLNRTIKGYRRLIPSMTALLEFEAVARLSSFTLAGQELGVTQAAVSKQVKFLEQTLGTPLFHRLHRAIRLTHEGQALYAVVTESMQRIAATFDRIAAGAAEQEVVLACTSAFTQLRVLPRLTALRQTLPNLQLRLATPQHHDVDLAVRYGNGKWDDGTSILLFNEEVFPVCSPAWLAGHPAPVVLEDLYPVQLIDFDATLEGWLTWSSWFKALDTTPPKLTCNLRCSLYADTIQAALQGHGIALGWGRLIDHLLASGELVRVGDYSVKPRDAYYLVVPNGRSATPTTHALVNWLRDGMAPFGASTPPTLSPAPHDLNSCELENKAR